MKTFKCFRCGMTFEIGYPRNWDVEQTFCAERVCRLPFWHTTGKSNARVGIFPFDAKFLLPDAAAATGRDSGNMKGISRHNEGKSFGTVLAPFAPSRFRNLR